MATAIPAAASVIAVRSPPALGIISPLAQRANPLFVVPSVIVTLGANSPVPLTYNAAGLFEFPLQAVDTATGTSGTATVPAAAANAPDTAITTTTVDSGTTVLGDVGTLFGFGTTATDSAFLNVSATAQTPPATTAAAAATTPTASNGALITTVASTGKPTSATITPALNSSLLGNADLTTASTQKLGGDTAATAAATAVGNAIDTVAAAAPAAAAPVDTTTVTPATAPATASAVVSNAPSAPVGTDTSGTPAGTSALADSFLDSVVQADATIEGNPAYASAAAGLYMSAMIFHSQQASAVGLASIADSVRPVTALPNVSAVKLVRK